MGLPRGILNHDILPRAITMPSCSGTFIQSPSFGGAGMHSRGMVPRYDSKFCVRVSYRMLNWVSARRFPVIRTNRSFDHKCPKRRAHAVRNYRCPYFRHVGSPKAAYFVYHGVCISYSVFMGFVTNPTPDRMSCCLNSSSNISSA